MASLLSYSGFDIENEEDKHIVREIVSNDQANKEVRLMAVVIALKFSLITFSKAESVLREIGTFKDIDETFDDFLEEYKSIDELATYDLTQVSECPICSEVLEITEGQSSFPQFGLKRNCSKGHFNQEVSSHNWCHIDFGLDDEDTWFSIPPYKNEKKVAELNEYIQKIGGTPIEKLRE